MSGRIFISYRRADSRGFSHAIYNYLVDHFGEPEIFMDVDDIEPGSDFHEILEDAVDACDVMIVLIGPRWINITDAEGNRRLDNPQDFVRIEVSRGLERNIKVIPVLVDGAPPVKAEDLPDNLKSLARRNVLFVGDQFNIDMERLIPVIERELEEAKKKRERKEKEKERARSKGSKKIPKWALFGGGLAAIVALIGLAIGLSGLVFNGSSPANNNIPSEEPVVEEIEEPVEEPVVEEMEEPAEEPMEESAVEPDLVLGSAEYPIKVLFPPYVYSDVDLMNDSVGLIAQALGDATGLVFEVSVPTTYREAIEEMCASSEDTIGFIPVFGYVIGNQLCGIQVGLSQDRFNWTMYWPAFYVARDSNYETLEDLNGAAWAYPDPFSLSGYLYPSSFLADLGVEPGENIVAGGHQEAVLAVYNGLADVGTAFYMPPELQDGTWAMGDNPDVPGDLITSCGPNESGRLYCGDFRVLDARASLASDNPDIVQQVRILPLPYEIPYDTVSFAPEFPDELKDTILTALTNYIASEACEETICNDRFYDWTGVAPIADENFDGVRILVAQQGITLENLDE